MKNKNILILCSTSLAVLLLVSCSSGNSLFSSPTATPTPEPTPTVTPGPVLSINGSITNTNDQSGREITLCKLGGNSSGYPVDCTVYNQSATVNTLGKFQFYDVPEGTYFILYDYTLGGVEFQEGMERWSGKILKIGDTDWLEENYFDLFPGGEMKIAMRAGMPLELIQNPGLLMAYNALTLQVTESPFVLAHTVNYANLSSLSAMVDLVKVTVFTDQTTEINITLY